MQWSDLNLAQWPHQGHPWVTGNFTGISSQKSFESDMKVGQTGGQTDMLIQIAPWWWRSFKETNTCTFNWCFTFTIAEVNIKFFGYFAGTPWSVSQSSHSVWGTFLLHVYLHQHYLCRNYGEGGDSWENNEWEKYKCRWVDSVAMSVIVWMLVIFIFFYFFVHSVYDPSLLWKFWIKPFNAYF